MTKTVAELARIGGQSVDRLLEQLRAAGVQVESGASEVSSADSEKLKAYLRQQRGTTSSGKLGVGGGKSKLSLGTRSQVQVKRKRSFDREAILAKEAEAAQAARLAAAQQSANAEREAAQRAQLDSAARAAEAAALEAATQQQSEIKQDPVAASSQDTATKQAPSPTPPTPKPAATGAKAGKKAASGAKAGEADKERGKAKGKAKSEKAKRSGSRRKGSLDIDARQRLTGDDYEAASLIAKPKKVVAATKQKIVELRNKHSFHKPVSAGSKLLRFRGERMEITQVAHELGLKSSQLVAALFKLGVAANINSSVDYDSCALLVEELGHRIEQQQQDDEIEQLVDYSQYQQQPRPAVVTIMGHVDHGKTTLLDYLRKSQVAADEHGGITQHIGAYRVQSEHGELTFLDTPGHAAFFNMRARGAQVTDVVVLVVAADDGVNQQTKEAIQHIRGAGCPMVVAINKIDKPNIDLERVRTELAQQEVVSEQWGGDTPFVEISAKTGQGVSTLVETIALQAELLELQAPRQAPAQGVVLEASVSTGLGSTATLLVKNGSLQPGVMIVAGASYGRIRTMLDEHGAQVKTALPATPVRVTGLNSVPTAGDNFQVVANEKQAREFSGAAGAKPGVGSGPATAGAELDPFQQLSEVKKQLNLVLKADVQGSLEAICATLLGLKNEQAEVNIVASGVGAIVESDVILAKNTQALLLGFNVRADNRARQLLQQEKLQPLYYSVIYELFEQIEQSLEKLQTPEATEQILGLAQVREVFTSAKFGQVAGCMVSEGTIYRSKKVRVLRDSVVIFEGELDSLRRFRDDVREVRSGFECGLGVRNYKDIKVGDQIEVFDLV